MSLSKLAGPLLGIVVSLANSGSATADDAFLLVLDGRPLPVGVTLPHGKEPYPDVKFGTQWPLYPMLYCAVVDIKSDGTVSNVKVVQSGGRALVDNILSDWYRERRWTPATKDGVPIDARIMVSYFRGKKQPKDVHCSWDMYYKNSEK
jgi:hypothetical protein